MKTSSTAIRRIGKPTPPRFRRTYGIAIVAVICFASMGFPTTIDISGG